ncbi:hypothetical protein [Streptomyces atratus]|uniref:hypothetical protein n=1 Tax=Streptomyces atratus TaxID=1893 RepID=UPI0022523F22|nr:hypothetical protein [Streptomyces atratus]MCX5341336.1 hypothetical protein [Streptomyces atratus]
MKKALISAFAAAIAVASLIIAPSASAAEVGTQDIDCDTWYTKTSPNVGYAKCTGMLPWPLEGAQVKLTCIDPHGKQWLIYGPRKGNGKTSSAKCSTDTNVGILKVGVNRTRI